MHIIKNKYKKRDYMAENEIDEYNNKYVGLYEPDLETKNIEYV